MLATVVAIVVVDRGGRRMLFFEGGVQMALAEVCMAGLIAWNFRAGAAALSSGVRPRASSMQCMLGAHLVAMSWPALPGMPCVGAGTLIALLHTCTRLHQQALKPGRKSEACSTALKTHAKTST